MTANYYKIKYIDDTFKIVSGTNALEVVQEYNLASIDNIDTRLIQLEGEQLAIAIANDNEY